MKKYIRIKVKHLLMGIFVILGISFLGYMYIPSLMFSIAEEYHKKGNALASRMYYERIDHYFPKHWKTPAAIERAAQLSSYENLLMVSPKGIGTANTLGGYLSEKTKMYYEELVKRFPDTPEGRRALEYLTLYSVKNKIGDGKIHEAFTIIQNYYTKEERMFRSYNLEMIKEAVATLKGEGHYQEGIRFAKYFLEKNSDVSYPDLYELLGDLYGMLGEQEEARNYYEQALEIYEKAHRDEHLLLNREHKEGMRTYFDEKKEEITTKISQLKDSPVETGRITGRITLHGEPLKEVYLFLQPYKENRYPIADYNALWTVSDENGSFAFERILPGRYGLGFVIDLDQTGDVVLKGGAFPKSIFEIEEGKNLHWDFHLVETMRVQSPIDGVVIHEDHVHFQWEPITGASYYTLELGVYTETGAYSRNISEKYFDSEAFIPIHELAEMPGGLVYDAEGPIGEIFFGYYRPGGKYFWGVVAYDEEGDIITASRGYLKSQNTDFSFPKKGLREGDQFLIERKYAKAIKAYENDLEKNPEDLYALKMLARIYDIPDGVYPYADKQKAQEYYQKIEEIQNR